MSVPNILRERLRRKIRDFKELNKLLDSQENEDVYLDDALTDALDTFNTEVMPITSYTFENFPAIGLLLKLAIIEILISNSILSSRNRVVYSDGKIGGIDTELKGGAYAEWASRLYNTTMNAVVALKSGQNLEQVSDYVSSDYNPDDESLEI